MAQQFAVAPTVTLTLGSLPPARLKLASGLFNLMRNLAARLALPCVRCSTTAPTCSRLADHLNSASLTLGDFQGRAQALMTSGLSPDAAHTAALQSLAALTLREARTAFSDAFWLIMTGFFVAALLVPLLKKPQG